MDSENMEEEEEIIIETECPSEEADERSPKDLMNVFKPELDDDDEFRWDQEDPFVEYDPPIRKMKKARKKRDVGEDGAGGPKSKGCPQKYKKDWENIPQFKKWLSVSIIGSEYFYCKICKIDAKCGKSEIMRHMTSKKHARNSQSTAPKKRHFEGLLCPVFTPMDRMRYEEIDYTKIADYAEYLKKCNVQAVLVNDILGEGMSLTVAERCLITEEWVKACEKTKQYLIVQVGGAPMKEVIRMVRHAVSKKANALLVLPDLYNKPTDHYDLLRYIKEISDHADSLPIWYHHCPKYSNVNIDTRKFLTDVSEIDNFSGVMFNSVSMDEIVAAASVNPRINVMVATDNGILGAASLGFKSIMSPTLNFLPSLVQNIHRAVQNDKLSEAKESQKSINDVFEIINEQGHPVAAMKSAMNIISKLNMGQVRRPLIDIWKKQIDQMKNEFRSLGIIA